MKKLTAMMLSFAMAATLLVGCGSAVKNTEKPEETDENVATEGTAVETEDAEKTDELTVADEGYVIKGDGFTAQVAWCKNGESKIFGRLYFPEDFDETKQYPTVLLVHGASLTCDFWHTQIAPNLARAGYVCYAFDERSGATGGRGSYSDPTETGESDANDAASDASAALDYIETLQYVNKDQIIIFGNSKGGIASQIVASERSDELAGLIVLYGSVSEDNSSMIADYDTVSANPYHGGEVLFVQGALDNALTAQRTFDNMAWYTDSSTIIISNAYHGFGKQEDRPTAILNAAVLDYLQRVTCDLSDDAFGIGDLTLTDGLYTKEESGEKLIICGKESTGLNSAVEEVNGDGKIVLYVINGQGDEITDSAAIAKADRMVSEFDQTLGK